MAFPLDLDAFELTEIPPKYLNTKLIEKHHAFYLFIRKVTHCLFAVSDPTNVTHWKILVSPSVYTEALLVDERKLQRAIQRLVDPTEDDFSKSMS